VTTPTTADRSIKYLLAATSIAAIVMSIVAASFSIQTRGLEEKLGEQDTAYKELDAKAKSAWNAQYVLEDAFCKARGHGEDLWYAYSEGYRNENSTLITAKINCIMEDGKRFEYVSTFDPAKDIQSKDDPAESNPA